ncbi:hypothetical protein [Zunongwangia sp. HRR-M8]|uniref:hypothetical protein n=1 Tax=Zunongwangia sp. HRR-M8 TaxID=3015170 RepID=UPI0022DD7935|nr:hypothetical protein [Zunongwangia sp. HRR-M8]WBL23681.1 hypothetical protein PBT89_06915 [Zunongwangia sp. HRR-M8]
MIGQRSGFLLTGSIIALLIAFSPYLFYLYEIFPDGPVWENFLFTYESKYYLNVMTAMWTYLGKITPLFLLLIWFFTCKHWWYHVILVPTIMYGYQLITALYQDMYMDIKPMDTNQLIYLAPFFIIIICIVYLIRIKIFDKIYGIDLSEIDETNISVFSSMSEKDLKEIDDMKNSPDTDEDYYAKL